MTCDFLCYRFQLGLIEFLECFCCGMDFEDIKDNLKEKYNL